MKEAQGQSGERPLFIPLRSKWFAQIYSGEKRHEYRAYGPRWNEGTCRVGRRVTVSRGYGKAQRLAKVIASFIVLDWADAPPEAQAIYPDAAYIARIELSPPTSTEGTEEVGK